MKKIIIRFFGLAVVFCMMAVIWSENVQFAKTVGCAEQLYQRWDTCDTNYSSKRVAYRSSPASCNQTCNEIYNPTAYPDWNQRNNLIQGCNEMCNRNAEQTFISDQNNYGTCLSNAPNCREELDFCDIARDRFSQCGQFIDQGDEMNAYMNCRSSSGIDLCQ